ncbi:MAG: glycerol-3-phosphate dehydrogenase/oxidase [Verrucomicrobia bacterium]|nr:glycerol-3-phosphate dehydrogenase/oxidase [Verrucomicrobiota bacterium]
MTREETLRAILNSPGPWDVIAIGGGATGLGAAVDAAARGYRALLLEQSDFAKGTSSRSTKLIHGGIRYLRQGRVSLVRESLRERGLLLQNAPHLVQARSFVIPAYSWWEGPFYAAGLKLYDSLAGQLGLGPSRILSREDTLRSLPTLRPEKLRGGVLYLDGQFDDARLALTLVHTLTDLGGLALNYARVESLLKKEGRVSGVRVRDLETGQEFQVHARAVINASGVFVDTIRRMDHPDAPSTITLSQGSHIVLDRSFLPGECALMIPKTDDGRVLFAIPWHDRVVVGTTDNPASETALEPHPAPGEIEYLLHHAARYLVRTPSRRDILSTFAGLRPLASSRKSPSTSEISRAQALEVSASGLVTVTGGKWTTYRSMGETAVTAAAHTAGMEPRPSRTRDLRLHAGTTEPEAPSHWRCYGGDAAKIRALVKEHPNGSERLHLNLPYQICEVVWAVRQEMARTVEDVLARRTRALILDARASVEIAAKVAQLVGTELGRDPRWIEEQTSSFIQLAKGYLP